MVLVKTYCNSAVFNSHYSQVEIPVVAFSRLILKLVNLFCIYKYMFTCQCVTLTKQIVEMQKCMFVCTKRNGWADLNEIWYVMMLKENEKYPPVPQYRRNLLS